MFKILEKPTFRGNDSLLFS